MRQPDKDTKLKLGSPAVYRIVVQGRLDLSLSGTLAGMHIETADSQAAGRAHETVLTGRLADQAQLIGVVNNLYDMRMPLLAVEKLQDGEWAPLQIEGEGSE